MTTWKLSPTQVVLPPACNVVLPCYKSSIVVMAELITCPFLAISANLIRACLSVLQRLARGMLMSGMLTSLMLYSLGARTTLTKLLVPGTSFWISQQ